MEKITVFVLQMHGAKIIDSVQSNIIGMILVEIENLKNDEIDELNIRIHRKQMNKSDYEKLPEFKGY